MTPPSAPVDLAAIEARHWKVVTENVDAGLYIGDCAICRQEWPCDAATLLALVRQMAGALDMESFRDYHNNSFLDPPSYHEDTDNLWLCPMCVHRFSERIVSLPTRGADATGEK